MLRWKLGNITKTPVDRIVMYACVVAKAGIPSQALHLAFTGQVVAPVTVVRIDSELKSKTSTCFI